MNGNGERNGAMRAGTGKHCFGLRTDGFTDPDRCRYTYLLMHTSHYTQLKLQVRYVLISYPFLNNKMEKKGFTFMFTFKFSSVFILSRFPSAPPVQNREFPVISLTYFGFSRNSRFQRYSSWRLALFKNITFFCRFCKSSR